MEDEKFRIASVEIHSIRALCFNPEKNKHDPKCVGENMDKCKICGSWVGYEDMWKPPCDKGAGGGG